MNAKLTFFLMLFVNTYLVTAQSKGDVITLKSHLEVVNQKQVKEEDKSLVNYLEPTIQFRINSISNDLVGLIAVPFNEKTNQAKSYNNVIYYVNKSDFEDSYKEFKPDDKISIGLLTLPFKARPQDDFSFDTEFNLSTTLNYKITSIYNADFNIQIGAGIGSVNLNSSNSQIDADKAQDVAALNFFTGLMLQYKKVQAGLYIGVDQINNQAQYQWQHNGNIWFGFGIGFNVFKISLGESQKQGK